MFVLYVLEYKSLQLSKVDFCTTESFYDMTRASLELGGTVVYVSHLLPYKKCIDIIKFLERRCAQFHVRDGYYKFDSARCIALVNELL